MGWARRALTWALATGVAVGVALSGAPAFAADGSIDFYEVDGENLRVLYSVPTANGESPDLDSVKLSLGDETLEATAAPASEEGDVTRRTVLAIDVSNSMAGGKFAAARKAARVFLDSAPADVEVGIVTFAGKVRLMQEPSLDRDASRAIIEGLSLSEGTSLYDGVVEAVRTSGADGPRSVLVLSDGRDSTQTELITATKAIEDAEVRVDVIALAQAAADEKLLEPLSDAGNGNVISAADEKELSAAFTTEAAKLAGQVVVTAPIPDDVDTEGTLALELAVGDETFTDSAFVTLPVAQKPSAGKSGPTTTLAPPAPPMVDVPARAVLGAVLMLGAGLLVLLVGMVGGFTKEPESIESRIEAFSTRGGAQARKTVEQSPTMAAQAVGFAQKALAGNQGFEAKLSGKLDAAGLSLKPAEWLLLHAGLAFGATALVFMLTSGDLLLALIGFGGGLLVPWLFLGMKQSRRLKAFNSQLAGTLQLLAGSLQAGLSVGQGMDTIVREGAEPVAGEFRRALVETRLGVQIEDALESIGERMMSDDFKWTVMAIRIQREVGGNLAELLLTVAATLRERDYLRRQVKSLSAEGRFSAYILLALPPGVMVFMYMTNRTYLAPLIETPMGWVMLAGMGLLMGVGGFMMSRMVKLEV